MFPFKKPKKHKFKDGRISLIIADHNIDCVLDIGANVGQTAENLRQQGYTGTIVSFEPVANCHATLLEKSKNDPHWHIYDRVAVSDKIGTVDINVGDGTDMSSILNPSDLLKQALPQSNMTHTETVNTTTLDTIVAELTGKYQNLYVKMDTQGYEYPILKASKTALKCITGIQLELSLFANYDGEKTYDEVLPILQKQGFAPYLLEPQYFSKTLNRQLQVEYVGIRA